MAQAACCMSNVDVTRDAAAFYPHPRREEEPCSILPKRAVKPRPSGRGYKAHLDWNFCLSAFCVLTGDTAAGHAVSACGEIVRPGGIGGWFVPVKFPTWECLRRKPSLVPLGSLVEAGTRSGMQSQDCLRWESPDFRRGRMSKKLFRIHVARASCFFHLYGIC